MQDLTQNIFRGLDTDSHHRDVDINSYVDANNIRIVPSSDNTKTHVTNLLGNELVGDFADYTKDGIVVGKCQDYQNGFIFFFVAAKTTAVKDFILKLDCNTNTVSYLIQSEYLFPNYRTAGVFKTNINPFVSAAIYDNKLFWCDGTDTEYAHPPRFIDTTKVYNTTDDITDIISVSLISPLYPLTCNVLFASNNTINYLNNYSYQFLYRYIYENGETSRFSPISRLAVSGYSQINLFPTEIEVTYGAVVHNNIETIKEVEFAFRESYENDFKSFKKIPYNEAFAVDAKFSFFGNEAYTTVAENDYITEYDNVPLLAEACEYADTRVFWGNYQQDRFKFDVTSDNGEVLSYSNKINKQCLKLGSRYKYAIDFIDHFGKRTTAYVSGTTPTGQVAIDINGSINTTPQDGLLANLEAQKIELELTDIPDDIEVIEVRRSKNLTVDRFIQGRIEHAYYKTGTNVNGKPVFIKGPDWTTTNYSNYNYRANKNLTTAGANEIYFDISNWPKSGINYTANAGDKLRVLTANNIDKKITKRGLDYSIVRQEGDILVASIESNENINRMCSLRTGNSGLSVPAVAMVGDFGGIWWSADGLDYIKATKDNVVVGWQDKFTSINFYGCCQYVNMFNGVYTAYNFMVVGDGGIILSVYYNTATKLFNITEVEAYDITKPAYRGITMNTVNGTNFFMCVVGDKNGSGNATVKLAYQVYGATGDYPTLTDKSDDYDIKANATVIKATLLNKDVNIDVTGLPVHFMTDSNDYIANLSLSSGTITPAGCTYTNIGYLNSTIWTDANKASVDSRLFISFTPVWLSTFVNGLGVVLPSFFGIYLVGENGLTAKIANTLASAATIGNTTYTQDLTDVCWNQFAGYTNDDRPMMFGVGSSGLTFTFPEDAFFSGNISALRLVVAPFTGTLTTCVYSYTDVPSGIFKHFKFAGYNNYAGTFREKTVSEYDFPTTIVETDIDVLNYGALIEVYTPAALASEQLYYEIGYCKEITTADSTLKLVLGDGGSNDLSGLGFENTKDGDCFAIKKKYYGRLWNHTADMILSMTPNGNTDTSWHKDIGRPNFEDLTVDFADTANELLIPFKHFTTNIIFSNQYIQGTKTNGLRNFEFLNYKQLPIEYGNISALQVANNTNEDGTVMLSIHKRESVSIYLGKVQFTDVSGVNTISLSNQILGSYRTINGSLGSVHGESICQYNSIVYGFDSLKGVVWRYAQNGLSRISDLGMRNFFYNEGIRHINDKSENTYNKIVSEYNPYYDEVIFTFMVSYGTSKSIIWSERLNRWTSIRDANPTNAIAEFVNVFHGSMYQKLYSCFHGEKIGSGVDVIQIEAHDSENVETNVMYANDPDNSVQRDCTVTFISNKNNDTSKTWETIKIQSDERWDANQVETDNGQETQMVGDYPWKKLEDYYYAPILRDVYNGGLYNGSQLKSRILKTELKLDKDKLAVENKESKVVSLFGAIIRYAISFR